MTTPATPTPATPARKPVRVSKLRFDDVPDEPGRVMTPWQVYCAFDWKDGPAYSFDGDDGKAAAMTRTLPAPAPAPKK